MSEWKIYDKMEQYLWDNWKPFPDPRKGDLLIAPFGYGVYQLRNKKTFEYILFGKGTHLAERMSSILPAPFGCGTRNNMEKRNYVFDHLDEIEYRSVSFLDKREMKNCEDVLRTLRVHKFNT